MKILKSIHFNSPVILSMSLCSLLILAVDMFLGEGVSRFFAVYYTSFSDPLMYLRLFTHILTHQDFAHYTGNFLMILAIGPMVEEKYNSNNMAFMIAITAVTTGLISVVFFKNIMLLGASGVVFMLIILASFVNIKEGKIPLTVILVAILYLGNEVAAGIFMSDNISQLSHIIGGLCGAGFGLFFHGKKIRKA